MDEDRHKPEKVWEKFQNHIEPKTNKFLSGYNFQQCRQTAEETVDDFVSRCRVMAGKWKFTCEDEVNIRLTEQLIIWSFVISLCIQTFAFSFSVFSHFHSS